MLVVATIVIYDWLYEPINTIELYHCLTLMKKFKGIIYYFIGIGNSLYIKAEKIEIDGYEVLNKINKYINERSNRAKRLLEPLRLYLKKNPNMQYRNVNITSFEIIEAIIRKNKEKF